MKQHTNARHLLKGSRASARRRMFLFAALWIALSIALVGAAGYGIRATGALEVQEVKVEGVRLANPEDVREAISRALAERPLRARFGRSLLPFWLFAKPDPSFFARYPMLKNLIVDIDVFGRKVVLRADERELSGVWCSTDGACQAFDGEGVAFGAAPSLRGTVVLKVTDERRTPLAVGEAVLADAAWRARFFETIAALGALRLAPARITVRDAALREWEINLLEGPLLRFSFMFVPEGLEDTLRTLARRPDFRSLKYLDFRVPDRLFYQ